MNTSKIKQTFNDVYLKLNKLNNAYTLKKYPIITPVRTFFGITGIGIVGYVLFRDKIKTHIASEASDIVNSPEVKNGVKNGLEDIINDNQTYKILDKWLNSHQTQKIITSSASNWLNNKETQQMLTTSTKIWLQQKETQDMLTEVASQWLKQDQTQQMLAESLVKLISRPDVKVASANLTKYSLWNSLPFGGYFVK